MKPLFISISGKKGSGKDEFARLLIRFLEEDMMKPNAEWFACHLTHFADPLKEMCIQLFGLDRNLVYGSNADKETLTSVKWDGFPDEVRNKYAIQLAFDGAVRSPALDSRRFGPMTIRELLQVMGTDIFRERVYANIWAELPFKQDYGDSVSAVLIADCRFPNEIEETLKNGGIVIKINRDTGHNDNHPSETALDSYNWQQPNHLVVDNNGSLRDLEDRAFNIAAAIKDTIRNRKDGK